MHVTSRDIAAAIARSAQVMREAENDLNAADAKIGDGDTGQTMRRLAETIDVRQQGSRFPTSVLSSVSWDWLAQARPDQVSEPWSASV